MLTLNALFWLTVLGALAVFWWQSDAVKHVALEAARNRCAHDGVQLLDQTLLLARLFPARGPDGQLGWRRHYLFEFSATGQDRYRGQIELQGRTVLRVELDAHVMP